VNARRSLLTTALVGAMLPADVPEVTWSEHGSTTGLASGMGVMPLRRASDVMSFL
jgi:hypothetical protein